MASDASTPSSDSAAGGVRSEQRDGIAIWTIDRPERRNALGRATVDRLGRLVTEAERDPQVRVVVLTGAGEQAFCAGADLKERQTMSEDDVRQLLDEYRSSLGALDRLAKPVVAAINGAALGGGLELALACDFRVMARSAVLGLPETALGIIPGAGGTQRLTHLVGPAKAKEWVLFARRLTADEAWREGVVHQLVPEGKGVLAHALDWVRPLATGPTVAYGAALEAIDAAVDHDLEAGLTQERWCYERTLQTADRLEGLAAFREKRPPRYRGS